MQPKENSATKRDEYNNKGVGSANIADHDKSSLYIQFISGLPNPPLL
jgi:hypothetical protein